MSDKIKTYEDARALGLSHEAALEVAHISRPIDYAAHVASGISKSEAAKAAGYSGDAGKEAREVAARALAMQEAAAGAGATPWLCPHHYRTQRIELEGRCAELRQMEDACLALVLSDLPTFGASDVDAGGSCQMGESTCGVEAADEG